MKKTIFIFLALTLFMFGACEEEEQTFKITAAAEGNGEITPRGDKSVPGGMNVTYAFAPMTSHVLEEVLVDGVSVPKAVENGRYTFTNVFAHHTITAKFVQKFTINASAWGGKILPEGLRAVSRGDNITFTFEAYKPEDKLIEVLIDGENNPGAVAAGSYTFTNVTDNHSIQARFKVVATEFAVINGVKWALRNVDEPGKFASGPEVIGKYYQWNRATAYSFPGGFNQPVIGWDATAPVVSENGLWEKANDPSPAGYRIPTESELRKLIDATKVTIVKSTENGLDGWRFTDKEDNSQSIFLPYRGYITDGGKSSGDYKFSGYWGAAISTATNLPWRMLISINPVDVASRSAKHGYSIRPVVAE